MKIFFHGATGDVTGSAYHVKTKHASVLVDCGLYQGGKESRAKNRRLAHSAGAWLSVTGGARPMSKSDGTVQRSDGISLADEEGVKQVLVNSVLGLWDVVNNLTRLRPSRRDRYRVTIFGSARAQPGTFGYEETKRAAAALAEMGCDIITGGGPGLMQAANEGAANAPDRSQSVGIRVDLPFEQEVNAFVTQAFEHRTFFTRLHQFVLASDAFIVAPGGIGTVLETMMIWQLLQVRHLQDTPLVLVGKMWPGLIEWARGSMLSFDPPLANAEDMTIPRCAATGDDAIAIIREHHATWLKQQKRA